MNRSQIKKIGMKPYTERLMEARARSLIEAFPNYDSKLKLRHTKMIDFLKLDFSKL